MSRCLFNDLQIKDSFAVYLILRLSQDARCGEALQCFVPCVRNT